MNDWWHNRLLTWGHSLITEGAIQQPATQAQCTKTSQTRPPGTMQDSRFKIQDSRFKLESRSAKPESGRRDFRVGQLNACCLFLVLLSWKFTALEVERSV